MFHNTLDRLPHALRSESRPQLLSWSLWLFRSNWRLCTTSSDPRRARGTGIWSRRHSPPLIGSVSTSFSFNGRAHCYCVSDEQFVWRIRFVLMSKRLTLVLLLPAPSTNNVPGEDTAATQNHRRIASTAKIAAALLVSHAMLFLFSQLVEGRGDDIIFFIVSDCNAYFANTLTAISIGIAFFHEASFSQDMKEPSMLSKRSIMLHGVLYLALAISWPFRLKLPSNLWSHGDQWPLVTEWYPWVGWPCVNSTAMAPGQAFMMLLISDRKERESQTAGETRPMLATADWLEWTRVAVRSYSS